MSKNPSNMLRTRRRDNNVKPNRRDSRFSRLDRKSSRGMIYENEELRLKTININAEIERGQSDIKKLKRENEMLKKEIWCLRDEYDKLDKLLKDKKIEFSSSSTTCSSSDSESCSSCSEESEEVETSQNLENVQKTNLKNIHVEFDNLSVVQEEPSTENSEKNSTINRNSCPNDWNFENNIIQPDQNYPIYENLHKSQSLPGHNKVPNNFFSPITNSGKSFDDNCIYPGQFYNNNVAHYPQPYPDERVLTQKTVNTNATNFYQNIMLVPKNAMAQQTVENMDKTTTDLIVKMDNNGFLDQGHLAPTTPSHSTFSNGGNLEELLHDIESISQDILKLSNLQRSCQPYPNGDANHDFLEEIQRGDLTYYQNPVMENLMGESTENEHHKPYKSELNVVLMPKSMPLIGFDKYKNIQRSFESLHKQSIEELSVSQQNLCVIPPDMNLPPPFIEPPLPPIPTQIITPPPCPTKTRENETNPFFFGNMKDNYVNPDYFNIRYNPDNYLTPEDKKEQIKTDKKSNSKSNLLDVNSSEHQSSENEENLKFKTSKTEKTNEENDPKTENKKQENQKPPKLSIRRKVSIHFSGKKDKNKKSDDSKKSDRKNSLFDIKFTDANKEKTKSQHLKTPSIESKKSTTDLNNVDPKTASSSESQKNSGNFEKKVEIKTNSDKNDILDKKGRKSLSVSPERKHVHVKEESSSGKKHKKHKRSDRSKARNTERNLRERSYSVCTDRSNFDNRFGFGGSLLYDDYSDREHTSMSSCETINNTRKMSTLSNVPMSGKVPWCGCWGNGCL